MVKSHNQEESKKAPEMQQHDYHFMNQNLKSFIMLTVKLFDKTQAEDILDKSLTSLITDQH